MLLFSTHLLHYCLRPEPRVREPDADTRGGACQATSPSHFPSPNITAWPPSWPPPSTRKLPCSRSTLTPGRHLSGWEHLSSRHHSQTALRMAWRRKNSSASRLRPLRHNKPQTTRPSHYHPMPPHPTLHRLPPKAQQQQQQQQYSTTASTQPASPPPTAKPSSAPPLAVSASRK